MALENNNSELIMPVGPLYGNNNGGFGNLGGDWASLIVLFLLAGMFNGGFGGFGGGWGGFGGYGNAQLSYDFPWLLNGQQGINANTNAGFRDAMINDGITSIRDGIAGLSTQLCSCCSDTQMALATGFAGVEQGANARQIANMQTAFANQQAMAQGFNNVQAQLAQCCCDNRLATQDVKYTIANEACASRATSTANTQAILDKLCQLELDNYKAQLDSKNDTIAQLRSEVLYARGQASQDVQTAELRANNATVANQLLAEMRACPIPAQPVYGTQPIFTCNNNGCGCGCGSI